MKKAWNLPSVNEEDNSKEDKGRCGKLMLSLAWFRRDPGAGEQQMRRFLMVNQKRYEDEIILKAG